MKPKINMIEIQVIDKTVDRGVIDPGRPNANVGLYRGAVNEIKNGVISWMWHDRSETYYAVTPSSLLRAQRAQIKLMER